MVGERGPHGDHGQQGEPGPQGIPGLQGKTGVPPWVVRQATVAYMLIILGVVISVVFTVWANDVNRERDRAQNRQQQQALCELANSNRIEINRNREGARKAYSAIQPAPGATAEQAARTIQFRAEVLATIDGDLPIIDCSAIGNGHIRDALKNVTTTKP